MSQTTVPVVPGQRFFNGSRANQTEAVLLAVVTLAYVAAVAVFLAIFSPPLREQHYSLQAQAWQRGNLDVPLNAGLVDLARYHDQGYVIYGPLPSVLLLPLQWVSGRTLPQEWLTYFLTAVNFCLWLWIGRALNFSWLNRWWLASSYLFGSVYLYVSLAFLSAYLAQVAATTGLLFAIGSVLMYRRNFRREEWWLPWCGVGIAMAGLARPPLFFAVLPVAVFVALSHLPRRVMLRSLVFVFTPVAVSIVALAWLNVARFGVWWEAGYHFMDWSYRGGLPASLFSLRYLPDNLYYLLAAPPALVIHDGVWVFPFFRPSLWGTSIVVTSPVLLWLLVRRSAGAMAWVSWFAVALLALPVLTYFGIGIKQIGYRYALDFLPFLYLLVLLTTKKSLPMAVKLLMLLGIFTNAWLVAAALV